MSSTPWRGTLIFAGTVAAVAAAATVRFSGAEVVAEPEGGATLAVGSAGPAQPAGSSSAGTAATASGTADGGATSGQAEPSASADAAAPPAATPEATPTAAPTPDQNVTIVGSTVQTRYGALQLSVTFAGSDVTAVQALQSPDWHGESRMINSYAIPILNQEAVAADSSGIDAVSGATVTSQAYVQSLQSAIDQHG